MSHVDDWAITGSEGFIEFPAEKMHNKAEVKVIDCSEAIYFGMKIANCTNEDTNDGEISTGIKLNPTATMAQFDLFLFYQKGMCSVRNFNCISESPLRSELAKLIWISRIAMSGALYDASVEARTFGNVNRSTGNRSSLGESMETNITSDEGDLKLPRVKGFSEFRQKS